MKPTTTHTIGPLHLEDLEPHRFEDLVRQLLYDFKPWKQLEATGRAGSDDGFDARGWEATTNTSDQEENRDEDESTNERLWLIQCKREKTIGPAKLLKYLQDIPEEERNAIAGIIFAAAYDFSKQSRDKFREQCRLFGFEECYLWGKAEIEDMLFQPKNDHLLFAYFGVSLQVRKRSLKTEIRNRLTIRKKLRDKISKHCNVLIRDASDERYPYLDEDDSKPRIERGRWRIYQVEGDYHDGLRILESRHYAFVDDDGESWDYFEDYNQNLSLKTDDPWDGSDDYRPNPTIQKLQAYWSQLPMQNKAWYELHIVVPYDKIIAIDEVGDEDWAYPVPHIYVDSFAPRFGPFLEGYYQVLSTIGSEGKNITPHPDKRVRRFPTLQEFEKTESKSQIDTVAHDWDPFLDI